MGTARLMSRGSRPTQSLLSTSSPRSTATSSPAATTLSSLLRAASSTLAAPRATPALSCPTPSPTRFLPRLSSGPTLTSTPLVSTSSPRSSTRRSPPPTLTSSASSSPSSPMTSPSTSASPLRAPSSQSTTATKQNHQTQQQQQQQQTPPWPRSSNFAAKRQSKANTAWCVSLFFWLWPVASFGLW